jgi:peptidoglycan/LPS O-acetylase OafA/YrhL
MSSKILASAALTGRTTMYGGLPNMSAHEIHNLVIAGALIWTVLAILVAMYATMKGYPGFPIFLAAVFLGFPLVLLAVTVAAGPRREPAPEPAPARHEPPVLATRGRRA